MSRDLDDCVFEHRIDRECHKIAVSLRDDLKIETAFHHPDWLCVSTQAGCALACSFCETGTRGFQRNLTAEEIIEQRDLALRISGVAETEAAGEREFRTISFSGMGEPLLNFDALAAAMRHLHRSTPSKLHVSTLGILPRLPDFFALDVPFALDLSLHATRDDVRTRLIPINARFPIAPLLETVFALNAKRRALLTVCYLLLDGINDSDDDLQRLTQLLHGHDLFVELKKYNPTSQGALRISPPDRFAAFLFGLRAAGIPAYVFGNEGLAIGAGCGQLVWSIDRPGSKGRRIGNPTLA